MAQFAMERSQAQPAAVAVANPAPLGLAAFALTTFVLSIANTGILPTGSASAVIGLALFYGGLGQLLAGMWEFKSGNTFGATAFSSYGCFWLAFGFTLWQKITFPPAALGWFLLAWGLITLLLLLSILRSNLALIGVFVFLTITFIVLGVAELTGTAALGQLGGWLGIITALIAWYTAWADLLALNQSTFTLPKGERNR
jgi:succinate-acetate transporter protein